MGKISWILLKKEFGKKGFLLEESCVGELP